MAKFILWAPRVLTLFIIVFIVLMALDNFTPATPIDKQMLGFTISISPALALLAGMIIAWRHKLTGGIIIIIMGITMTLLLRTYEHKLSFLLLSTPVLVTGILFVLNYFYEKPSPQN